MRRLATIGVWILALSSSVSFGAIPTIEEAANIRAEGSAGIDRLMGMQRQLQAEYRQALNEYSSKPTTQLEATMAARLEEINQLEPVIDAAAACRYAHTSGLYWYTDRDEALAAAREANKPVLSLRMLGKLDEDLSCANSRFFRTVLYPNEKIRQLLHEKYILLWESVRPAPVITIDFGDGRKIVRTITGNSIHYVLLPDGTVVDALPGMYGPAAFLKQLTAASKAIPNMLAATDTNARKQLLDEHVTAALRRLEENWKADIQQMPQALNLPDMKLNGSVGAVPAGVDDEQFWSAMGRLHPDPLDETTRTLAVSLKTAVAAGRLARGKQMVEMPGMRMVRNLEGSIAFDTARNEFQFRTQILLWLRHNPAFRTNQNQLNEVVYANLFLTPSSDPWLGLALPDVYSALPGGGVVLPPTPEQGQQQQAAAPPSPAGIPASPDRLRQVLQALAEPKTSPTP